MIKKFIFILIIINSCKTPVNKGDENLTNNQKTKIDSTLQSHEKDFYAIVKN